LLPPGQQPQLVDLKRDSPPVSLPEIGSSTNVLGCFGTNILCYWDGTNQIVVRELRGMEFVQRGAIALESGRRPAGFTYNPARQLLAWTEGTSSTSLYLASLAAPGRRVELRSDVPVASFYLSGEGSHRGPQPQAVTRGDVASFYFSGEGSHLAAATKGLDSLRVWNVESGQIVRSINQNFSEACFAANGSVLVVALRNRIRCEIGFYDLAHPDRAPQRVPGGFYSAKLAVSPDGGLVSATPLSGQILLLDPAKGRLIESLHGHINIANRCAFSPDGRRLISTYGGREAVKLWDVATHQELLTLAGADSGVSAARWSADGNVILVGPPWQVWSAPSLEEIEAAEAKDSPSSDVGGQAKTESKQP
jgi:hypothetical protein